MQEDIMKEFSPLISKPSWFMTWLTRIFGVLILLIVFLAILALPAILCNQVMVLVAVGILYYPVVAFLLYRFFRYQKKIRKREVKKIVVDDKGVHYERFDGSVDEVLYANLEKYCFSDEYDVGLSPRNKQYMLQVNDRGYVVDVDFEGMDAGYTYYIKNLKALRRRYLQGIAHFRPDLRINPWIYSVYSINPVDFTCDRKEYWTSMLKVGGVLMLVCLVSGLVLYKLAT
ncbi:hypothetical protein [Chryseobacterium rhizosphaerae]|nr:hypothetical protein [Chryseobacterium rhizosphaerae]